MQASITFIGGGNMAASLIGGLIANGHPAGDIKVVDPSEARRAFLTDKHGVVCSAMTETDLAAQDVIVLAVKPQIMADVCQNLAPLIQGANPPLMLSIAAGIRSQSLQRWLGADAPIVRCMPNTPALIGSGASALYADDQIDAQQRSLAESILRCAGVTCWVDSEDLIDSVTAISGSGPAYYFLFTEALQASGEALGLDTQTARLLALQTAYGAACMALESTDSLTDLRQNVTSPGGTTERAIASLEENGLRSLVEQATQAAAERSRELADELGNTPDTEDK